MIDLLSHKNRVVVQNKTIPDLPTELNEANKTIKDTTKYLINDNYNPIIIQLLSKTIHRRSMNYYCQVRRRSETDHLGKTTADKTGIRLPC